MMLGVLVEMPRDLLICKRFKMHWNFIMTPTADIQVLIQTVVVGGMSVTRAILLLETVLLNQCQILRKILSPQVIVADIDIIDMALVPADALYQKGLSMF